MTSLEATNDWHRADIIAAIHKRNSTLRQISLDAGLAESTCRTSLHKPCPTANEAIADFIDVPLHVLWPDWFNRFGEPKYTDSPRKRSRKRRRPLSENAKAA